MSYADVPPESRAVIEASLTDLQLQVFRARVDTFTFRQIATAMDIDESTVRGHYERALRRIAKAVEAKEAA